MIPRREFVALVGGAALGWPLTARAQQPKMQVIGFLSGRSERDSTANVAAFLRGLAETGYVEGRNVAIEYRWADGQYDRLPALAADLIRRSVTLVATTGGTASAVAAKQASATIPVVFLVAIDPVQLGLVASINRPGANITGVSFLVGELTRKRFELLHELVPQAMLYGMIVNPEYSDSKIHVPDAQAAASALGLKLVVVNATNDSEIDDAFHALAREQVSALVIDSDPFFNSRLQQLAALALATQCPTIAPLREFTTAGGLLSYGTSITDGHRQIGNYAGRILKGEKPSDLPVTQPTKFELVINLKTAKALGLTIPLPLQAAADEVIE